MASQAGPDGCLAYYISSSAGWRGDPSDHGGGPPVTRVSRGCHDAERGTVSVKDSIPLVPELLSLDGPGGPHLRGSRCPECGEVSFPFRPVCPRCKTEATEEIPLGRGARLYSFTVCYTAPEGWRAPYLQAYVELPEGIRVFTLISDAVPPETGSLRVGMPMDLVVEPARTGPGGETYSTYKFRPQIGDQDA